MIIRLVRMNFKPEESANFLELYKTIHSKIQAFPGCQSVELYQEVLDEHSFTTYSIWETHEALDTYRDSGLFQSIWPKVKEMMRNKATAISYHKASL